MISIHTPVDHNIRKAMIKEFNHGARNTECGDFGREWTYFNNMLPSVQDADKEKKRKAEEQLDSQTGHMEVAETVDGDTP